MSFETWIESYEMSGVQKIFEAFDAMRLVLYVYRYRICTAAFNIYSLIKQH